MKCTTLFQGTMVTEAVLNIRGGFTLFTLTEKILSVHWPWRASRN